MQLRLSGSNLAGLLKLGQHVSVCMSMCWNGGGGPGAENLQCCAKDSGTCLLLSIQNYSEAFSYSRHVARVINISDKNKESCNSWHDREGALTSTPLSQSGIKWIKTVWIHQRNVDILPSTHILQHLQSTFINCTRTLFMVKGSYTKYHILLVGFL